MNSLVWYFLLSSSNKSKWRDTNCFRVKRALCERHDCDGDSFAADGDTDKEYDVDGQDDMMPNEVEQDVRKEGAEDRDIFDVEMVKPVFNQRRPTKVGGNGKKSMLNIFCLPAYA